MMSDYTIDHNAGSGIGVEGSSSEAHSNPPWGWSTLALSERAQLVRCLDHYVADYNEVFAREVAELVPPCWPQHPALAADLAAHFWLLAATHADPAADPRSAVEFYEVHLPRFRRNVEGLLGQNAELCRGGQHRPSNLHTLQVRATFVREDGDNPELVAAQLGDRHFGLAYLDQMRRAGASRPYR